MEIKDAIKIAQNSIQNASFGEDVTVSREVLKALLKIQSPTLIPKAKELQRNLNRRAKERVKQVEKAQNKFKVMAENYQKFKELSCGHFFEEYTMSERELANWYYTIEKIDWRDL